MTLARLLGMPWRSVHRWKVKGYVPVFEADRAASLLGYHPAEVWGAAWWSLRDGDGRS